MVVKCLTRVRHAGALFMPGEFIHGLHEYRIEQLVRSGAAIIVPEPEVVKAVCTEDHAVELPTVPEPEVVINGLDGGEPVLRKQTTRRSVGSSDGSAKTKSVGNGRGRSKTVQAEG